ncbi:MAG: Coq4 family protein [Pseudomonadota bacterium]
MSSSPDQTTQSVEIAGYQCPTKRPIRPVHAVISSAKLMANRQDTRQVFEVLNALSGGSSQRVFARMAQTPYGLRVINGETEFEQKLADDAYLSGLATGTFGRAFYEFREASALTPDGIIAASDETGKDQEIIDRFPEFARVFRHAELCHDLWHIITGYGTDALGELCLLGFTRKQTFNNAFRVIIAMGSGAIKLEAPKAPILKAIAEGVENGKNAKFLLGEDIEALLEMPLEEARASMNVAAPTVYASVPAKEKATYLKPRITKTQTEREQGVAAAA